MALSRTQAAARILAAVQVHDDLGGRVWAPTGDSGPVRVYLCQIHARKGAVDLGYLEITEQGKVRSKLSKWEVRIEALWTDALAGEAVVSAEQVAIPRQALEDEDGNPLETTVPDRCGDE